jgi:hypothetical protein
LKSLTLFPALLLVAACAAPAATDPDATSALETTAAPTPASMDATAALAAMKTAFASGHGAASPSFQPVDLAVVSPTLATRFDRAKQSLESFSFAHADTGNSNSRILYALTAPSASTFVGFVVCAGASDNAQRYKGKSVAYYTTDGELLDIESTSVGISDNEDAGDFSHADHAQLAAEEATLRGALSFDGQSHRVDVDPAKAARADAAALPFAALVGRLRTELEGSTLAHADLGDSVTRLMSVKDASGSVAGYVLTSEGGDDADNWGAAGYALFSAAGQLLAREIATGGFADTMDDDSVLLPAN